MKKDRPIRVVKSFTISRKRWGTGWLLGPDGNMCCLGFQAKACGFEDHELTEQGMWPAGAYAPTEFLGLPVDVREDLSGINDSKTMAPDLKEAHIAGICALHDIKVRFVP